MRELAETSGRTDVLDFAGAGTEEFREHAAMCDETAFGAVIWRPGMCAGR